MDFAPHLRQAFALRGKPARYIPVSGPEIEGFKAIRQGGGQPVQIGPVRVTLQRISFHVLRADLPNPAEGAALEIGGETFTVDAVQPVERDTDALKWDLHVSWGAAITYRSVTGSGSTQNPPQGSDFTVSAAVSAGVLAIGIRSGFTIGRLLPGDRFTIAGNATEYTVGSPGVNAVSNVFANVPITPALAANAAQGAAVTFSFQRDFALRAAVAAYQTSDVLAGVQVGDRRLVLMQSQIAAKGMADEPKAGDRIIMAGRSLNVITAAPLYAGAAAQAWDIQARG